MRKRTIARVLAVVLGAALALGALAGCQSPATGATDQQQANRTYMTKVNQAVEELNTRLGEFDEAVAQESVVNMRNKANSAFEAIDALAARSVVSCEVIAFPELGCEAVKRLVVRDFPLIVGVDCHGGNLFAGG